MRGGAGHERDDQPAPSFLHELNRAKRVRGGAGPEGDDQPAPRCAPQPARHHPAAGEGRPACRHQRKT